MTKSKQYGKRLRQERAIKRTEASLLKWEEEFKNPKAVSYTHLTLPTILLV